MEQMSMDKAIAAVITGIAAIAATVFSVNTDWLSPELVVTLGSVFTAAVVWLVPNKPVE